MDNIIQEYNQLLSDRSPGEVISFFTGRFPGQVAFATSLGAEDQVIHKLIAENGNDIMIFTLDTGRMFQETYDLLDITEKKYGMKIQVFFPVSEDVEEMVSSHGINLFYESVRNRKLCCHIRKVEPLKRALHGMKAWITGQRREQSSTREELAIVEWDERHGMIKVNPLADWSQEQVWDFIRKKGIPYNPLHYKGYPSIGCLPCTRAVQPGEDIRAGRWWWENKNNRECGIHSLD